MNILYKSAFSILLLLTMHSCAVMQPLMDVLNPPLPETSSTEGEKTANVNSIVLSNTQVQKEEKLSNEFGNFSNENSTNLDNFKNIDASVQKTTNPENTPNYKRHNPEADLNRPQDGSLFDSYSGLGFYFTRNQLRKVDDILIVKIGDHINEFLRAKIRYALQKKYGDINEKVFAEKELAEAKSTEDGKDSEKIEKEKPKEDTKTKQKDLSKGTESNNLAEKEARKVEIGDVTVRILKDLGRGTYEIGGEKSIFIQNKKYLMGMYGVVRSEDIHVDGTVASEKLADSRVEFKR